MRLGTGGGGLEIIGRNCPYVEYCGNVDGIDTGI